MSPWPDIERAIRDAVGKPFSLSSRDRVGGGDINECHVVHGGQHAWFVKLNRPDRAGMFAAEAAGLEAIRNAGAVRVPRPLCFGGNAAASWLVLEHLDGLRPAGDEALGALGRGLARLHRFTRDRYGWDRDNTLGSTPQVNTPANDWISFWREHRLGFQLRLATENGHARALVANGERLMEKLPAFFGHYRPTPSLLHGDLWSGNAAMTANGEPVIYDPATYYGDREADLAMTELFGGFPRAFYDAYRAEYPLDPGYGTRKGLYNLYHVLNHLNLFGGSYAAQAERMIGQLLAAV